MTKIDTLITVVFAIISIGFIILFVFVTIFLPLAVYKELQTPEVQGALDKVPKWQLQVIAYMGIVILIALAVSGVLVTIEKARVEEE